MADSFTQVTREGYFQRIGKSIVGVFVGGIVALIAFPLLFVNEGCAVKTAKTLDEGLHAVVSLPTERVDPAHDQHLIHISTAATTDETLTDPQFGIADKALRLRRVAEMYQWKEKKEERTRNRTGGSTETVTTYSYSKVWESGRIDSDQFQASHRAGHENPPLPYPPQTWDAREVHFGAFELSPSQVTELTEFEKLPLPATHELPKAEAEGELAKWKRHDEGYYLGNNPASPQLGDVRVRFEVVPPGPVSVVGRQVGNKFAPYTAKVTGQELEVMISQGTQTAQEMFTAAQFRNTLRTWGLRAAGFVVMGIGFAMVFAPLGVLADVLPFAGNLMRMGTGLVALLLASVFSLLTISVAWVVYRPVLGVALFLAAIGIFMAYKMLSRSKQVEFAPPPPPPPPQ